MNKYHILCCTLLTLTPTAFAQVANTAESVQIQAATGQVTVRSSQPTSLAKGSDYTVKIADLDTNGDGRLSRREIPASHALSFEFHLVDRNHNGFITAAELDAANWK